MALDTYTVASRFKLENPIATRIAVTSVLGSWSFASGNVTKTYYNANEVHLYTTGSYRYVGCAYDEAYSVAQQLAAALVFEQKYSIWNSSSGEFEEATLGKTIQADIAIVKQVGHLYDVVVNIDADDVRLRIPTTTVDYTLLFADEDARDWTPEVS